MPKKITGKFKTRKELEQFCVERYYTDRMTVKVVGIEAGISQGTADRIISDHVGNGREKRSMSEAMIISRNGQTPVTKTPESEILKTFTGMPLCADYDKVQVTISFSKNVPFTEKMAKNLQDLICESRNAAAMTILEGVS